ncbi:MAG: hypothetical protein D6702_12855 [Planctomycetota bacterium]|nr:MAG: hypothetical protein D6702_12855 [Planctomycetota bacterium]
MVDLGFSYRLREFLTSRKFLWIVTGLFSGLVVLYFLFLTFFFDPFEDPLADTAEIVPREAEYFLRWKGAGQRFSSFPVPKVWEEFRASRAWKDMETAGLATEWDQEFGISEIVARLGSIHESLPPGLSLEDDLLQEVALAGNGQPTLDATFDGVLMLRVSFKIKAAVSMLGYDFMRSKLPESLGIEELGDDTYRLPQFAPFGYQDAFLSRIRDVVLLASRKEWIDRARQLDLQGGENSLATSSVFHDNVEAYLNAGEQPLEVFVRWEPMRRRFGSWPDPQPGQVVPLALSVFFNTDLLRYAAGYWRPGQVFEGRFSGEIDRSRLTPFQRSWAESSSLGPNTLAEFAGMVPADSFLFAGVAGNPGSVLRELSVVIPEDLRALIDEALVNSGQYQGLAHLLNDVSESFQSGLFLAMRRDDYPLMEGLEVEHDDFPAPLFVVIGRPKSEAAYQALEEFFRDKIGLMFSGQQAPVVESVPVGGGENAISFTTPLIRGTGEIVMHRLTVGRRQYVLISNSFKYLRHVEDTAFLAAEDPAAAERKLAALPAFQRATGLLQRGANLFVWFDPDEAREWSERFAVEVARQMFLEESDQLAARWRPEEERKQRDFLFPGLTALNQAQLEQLQEAVDEALLERLEPEWGRRQEELIGRARRAFLPARALDWFNLALEMNLRSVSLVLSGELALD